MEFINSDGKFTPPLFGVESVQKSKARGQRGILIEDFCKELDKEVGTRWKDKYGAWHKVEKVKPAFIAWKVSHLNVAELFQFLSQCKQSKSGFRKCFFGSLKVDKSI